MYAGPQRQQHAELTLFEFAGPHLLVDENREGSGARISEALDVRGEFLRRDAEVLANVFVYSSVGLMRKKPVDRFDRRVRLGAKGSRAFGKFGDGELEELASVHGGNVLLLVIVAVL